MTVSNYNTCTICGEVKTVDLFIKDKRIARGFRNQCKDCEVKRVALSLGQTYGQRGSISRIHSKNLVAPEYVETFDYFRKKMNGCNHRTSKNGKPAAVGDLMSYWEILLKQEFKCALTGEHMSMVTGDPNQLSVDCIIPALGYTPDNVQFVTWAANRAKGDLTNKQFKELVINLYNHIIK